MPGQLKGERESKPTVFFALGCGGERLGLLARLPTGYIRRTCRACRRRSVRIDLVDVFEETGSSVLAHHGPDGGRFMPRAIQGLSGGAVP